MSQEGFEPSLIDDTSYEADALSTRAPRQDLIFNFFVLLQTAFLCIAVFWPFGEPIFFKDFNYPESKASRGFCADKLGNASVVTLKYSIGNFADMYSD